MSDSAEAKALELSETISLKVFTGQDLQSPYVAKLVGEVTMLIAVALREWGEVEVKKAHKEWLKDQCLDDVAKRADAEGYARGFAEGKTQGQQKHE